MYIIITIYYNYLLEKYVCINEREGDGDTTID